MSFFDLVLQKSDGAEDASHWQGALSAVHQLHSLVLPAGEIPIVKTHPSCIKLAGDLLDGTRATPKGRALLIYSTLEDFLTSVLPDHHRMGWAREMAAVLNPPAIQRELSEMSDAQSAAICWVSHMACYRRCIETVTNCRFRAVRHQTLYQAPEDTLWAVSELLELGLSLGECNRIARSEVFARHSKLGGPYTYQQQLSDARQRRSKVEKEICEAKDWLSQFDGVLAQNCQWPPQNLHLCVA
jgi:hypothetical protein